MQDTEYKILVWLPSPMGDAILCTPALRAIRQHFKSARISFLANTVDREILSPCPFNDTWLEQKHSNPATIAKMLKAHKFTHSILFKNSFASALAVFLAAIPVRVGYAREGRSALLTDRLYPPKLFDGRFKPISMIDYYLAIASWLGANTNNRNLELLVDPQKEHSLHSKLPELTDRKGPLVIIVPGGAFGPSKRWPGERFARTADWLTDHYGATVVVSASSDVAEKKIAGEICTSSRHKIINLAENPITLSELKVLFAVADLVITNDTGPRHIATALGCKVITLFGPNDPAWTETGYENEIKIVGHAPCAPCAKPVCKKKKHLCMEAITVEMVSNAAAKLLKNQEKQPSSAARQKFAEISNSFFIDADFVQPLRKLDLTNTDAVFSFKAGHNLAKNNIAAFRSRLKFELKSPPTTLFLKRYDNPPLLSQLRNWWCHHRRVSYGLSEVNAIQKLSAAGINTPKTICYGQQWGWLFEKRSFCITEKIPNAESLERKLPRCFSGPNTIENFKLRQNFITRLAAFIRKFHETDLRHRDLYFSHIFYDDNGRFYLIDLARVFKPLVFTKRFLIKDIAQLYYSASGQYFSRTDRLRFYLKYTGRSELTAKDKVFIRKVVNKTVRMERHDVKHGRPVPFATKQTRHKPAQALFPTKRKIAIIIERADITLGGAERSVFELTSALTARGLQVDVLAAKGLTKAGSIHILCRTEPGKRTWHSTFAKAIKKHLTENHYDIVHSVLPFDFADIYQPRGGSFAEAILRNASSYQNRFVQNCKKATAFANLNRAALLRAEKKLCNNTNGPVIAALSKYVADQFKKRYNLNDSRIVVIPNGVRVDERIDTPAAGKLREQILAKLNLKETDNPVFFLFAANNFRLKGLAVLIKAMHLAVTRHHASNAYLVVAGRDRSRAYRHLAKKLEVDTRIIFLGKVRHIQNALLITDVAAAPTFYDPSSRFTLEALAAGKPVITTAFNGATDLFNSSTHGKVIASPHDISQLAVAIAHFTDPENIKKAAEAIAQDNLKEKISIKRIAQLTEALYESVIEKRSQK